MKSFKDLAYTILKESGKPLHSKEITKRALKIGLITEGKTPEATMNAQLVVDINAKKQKSRFIKTDPSTFSINPEFEETKQKIEKEKKAEKIYKISKDISTKQKGDIWEYLWFVPAPDFLKMANKLDGGKSLGFVAGRKRKDSNKWDSYLIDKRDLANQIIAQMKRI